MAIMKGLGMKTWGKHTKQNGKDKDTQLKRQIMDTYNEKKIQ